MPENRKSFQEKALTTLIENAYDFLGTALENLEKNTKRSVIDFYTAVELFLKAPLLNEHWSLIVFKDPSFQKFKSGDFTSIGFHESIKRLNEVLEVNISPDTQRTFDKVRKHRNQYVHLFIDENEDKLASISLEQSLAWAHLLSLIKNQFSNVFREYSDKNSQIETSLRRNLHFWQEYAKLKLPTISDLIDKKRQAGGIISLCVNCETESIVTEEVNCDIFESTCLICSSHHQLIALKCPHCSEAIKLTEGYDKCSSCDHGFSPKELYEVFDTYQGRQKDRILDGLLASCNLCERYESVCEFNDGFLCTNCFAITDSLTNCDYCTTSLNYVDEFSYSIGCGFCDGAMGR